MRFFLTFMISFQLMASSQASELGEKKPFTVSRHLYSVMSFFESRDFEATLRKEILRTEKEGFTYLQQIYKPTFKETQTGQWEYRAQGNTISFSSEDIFQGQILINGKALSFKDVPLNELERRAEKLLVTKTSFLEKVLYQTIGIDKAQACELVCAAVIVVIVAAVIGTAVYQLMVKPEKIVKRLNEMKKKLERDANTCEEAGNDQSKYMQTFDLANSIGNRSALGSVTSSSEALEYSIKKQLESGNRNNDDCYQIMHEVGKKVDVNIPVPSQRQIQMREIAGTRLQNEKVDVANAAFNLCESYNKLGSCMENFVSAHVNDSDINTFKESATPSHYRYQRRIQSGSRQ